MTEQDRPTGVNPEALTGKPNPHRMGDKGDIFMPDSGQPEQPQLTDRERSLQEAGFREGRQYGRSEADQAYRSCGEIPEGFSSGIPTDEEKHIASSLASGLITLESTGPISFPDGMGGEKTITPTDSHSELEGELVKSLMVHREKNLQKTPAEIYAHLKSIYQTAQTEEDLIGAIQRDIGWYSVVTTILEKISSGELPIDADKKEGFIRDLEEVGKIITDIQTGKGLNGRSLEDIKGKLDKLAENPDDKEGPSLKNYLLQYETIQREIIPKCIEDLGRLIMDAEKEEWRTGGEFAILNEKGEFQAHNFMAWVRSRILWYHDQTPDADINLFSEISVSTMYRVISFGEMIGYSKYFMTREKRVNPKAGFRESESYAHSEELENLKKLALHEVWLFQMSHNFDAKYRAFMGNEAKLPEAMAEIFYNNVFTKNKMRLLKILMLGGNNAGEMALVISKRDEHGKLIDVEDQTDQGSVGKAIRRILISYYHIPEISYNSGDSHIEGGNMFEKVLGQEGLLKFYKYIIGNVGGLDELRNWAEVNDIKKIKEKASELLIAKRGLDGLNDLNIFNHPKVPEEIKDLVKDAFKRAVGKNAYLLEDLKKADPELFNRLCQNDSGLDKKEAEYAAEWVSTMVHWTGIGAKNDTSAIGFDAWSKLQNMSEYRTRQQQGKSAAGDLLNMFGIKKISMDFLLGTKVSTGSRYSQASFDRTLLDLLQGGKGDTVNLDAPMEIFEFQGNSSRKFMEDHLMNAFAVYKWLMEAHGINYAKMLNIDSVGHAVVNQEEVDKVFKGLWKNLRYSLDMCEFLYGIQVRGWEKKGKEIMFTSKKLEEFVLNDEVRSLKMYNEDLTEDDSREFKKNGFRKDGSRKQVARMAFAWLIAKDIEQHVHRISGNRKYSSLAIERIMDFYTHYAFGLEEGDDHIVLAKNVFFTEKEFKDILKLGRSSYWRVFGVEAGQEGAGTTLEMIGVFFKEFLKALLKG